MLCVFRNFNSGAIFNYILFMKKTSKRKVPHPAKDLTDLNHQELSGTDENILYDLSLSDEDEDEKEGLGDGNIHSSAKRSHDFPDEEE